MQPTLDEILDLLCDGKCHRLAELQERGNLSERQAREAVACLAKYGFVELALGNEGVKISLAAKELFDQRNI